MAMLLGQALKWSITSLRFCFDPRARLYSYYTSQIKSLMVCLSYRPRLELAASWDPREWLWTGMGISLWWIINLAVSSPSSPMASLLGVLEAAGPLTATLQV